MAVIKSLKQTPTEKRLQLLREQLYGKDRLQDSPAKISHTRDSVKIKTEFIAPVKSYHADISYLRADLIKILILASIAFAAQITLYVLFVVRGL